MSTTSIEWTDISWNPVVGCTRVSPGCEHCYAETMAARNVLMAEAQGRRSVYLPVVDAQRRRWTREVALLPERLDDRFRPGTRVFVVSMGDPFHDGVPFEFLAQMWQAMAAAPEVTFQLLTKRPARMLEFLEWFAAEADAHSERARVQYLPHLANVWLGVSVEDQQRADERIPLLLEAPAAVRFLSCEPLLGPIKLREEWLRHDFNHEPHCPWCEVCVGKRSDWREQRPERHGPFLDWVIVGGESGPGARPMDGAWVRQLRDDCESVAFFFKQWGGVNKAKAGRELDGRTHDAMPEVRRG